MARPVSVLKTTKRQWLVCFKVINIRLLQHPICFYFICWLSMTVLCFYSISILFPLLYFDCLLCSCLQRLVVKPDQLIKRRGKLGLVGINLELQGVRDWVKTHLLKETVVSATHCSIPSHPVFSHSLFCWLPCLQKCRNGKGWSPSVVVFIEGVICKICNFKRALVYMKKKKSLYLFLSLAFWDSTWDLSVLLQSLID